MDLRSLFKFSGKFEKNLVKVNLIFIFLFLNIWDFVTSREFINAMVLGMVMFSPAAFLWYVGTLRAIALLTLISIFEFTVMLIFILQGFELGGLDSTIKSIFWLPYLAMAGLNGFWGLKIYSENKESLKKEDSLRSSSLDTSTKLSASKLGTAGLKEKKSRA